MLLNVCVPLTRPRPCILLEIKDPAAVVYDPTHNIYHDHWEDHLAIPGGQYVRGHAVSRDLVHWARMPVSLWNDKPYDNYAIFTVRCARPCALGTYAS